MAHKSNEEQIEEIKAEARQAWSDAQSIAAKSSGAALGLWATRPIAASRRAAFAEQLARGLAAGLTAESAIAATKDDARAGRMAAVVEGLLADLADGEQLFVAMAKHPGAFDVFELSVAEAGVRTGHPARAFAGIAAHLRTRASVEAKVIGDLAKSPLLLAALFCLIVVPLSASGFWGFVGTALATAFGLAALAASAVGGWLVIRRDPAATAKARGVLGRIKPLQKALILEESGDFLAAFSAAVACGLRANRALVVAAKATRSEALQVAIPGAVERLASGDDPKVVIAELPILEGSDKAALTPEHGDVVGALADRLPKRVEAYVSHTSKLGLAVHWGAAALIALAGLGLRSSGADPALADAAATEVNAEKTATDSTENTGAGGALHKRLTGQKGADDRANRALGGH